jgi:hypothetical protein
MAPESDGRKAEETPAPDVAEAAKAETAGKPRTIQFRTLSLKLPEKLPLRALRHLRDEKTLTGSDVYGVLEQILGEEQLDEVCDLGADVDEGGKLLEQILAELGTSTGESPASRGS